MKENEDTNVISGPSLPFLMSSLGPTEQMPNNPRSRCFSSGQVLQLKMNKSLKDSIGGVEGDVSGISLIKRRSSLHSLSKLKTVME